MNKIVLIGNLTRDPESSTTNSGITMCRFGIAVNRPFANADGVRETDFFNITTWRNLADRCSKYLKKGNKVAITGTVQIRNYESNGEKRIAVDVIADDVEFLTPKGEGGAPLFEEESTPAPASEDKSKAAAKVVELEPVEDSDLPF
ncbi:MAG: single-stranded DNA-binding protein [Clostridia bacterium]|nr:single-stranded DNA-binding protein [Clostridia bacterium]